LSLLESPLKAATRASLDRARFPGFDQRAAATMGIETIILVVVIVLIVLFRSGLHRARSYPRLGAAHGVGPDASFRPTSDASPIWSAWPA